MISTIERNGTKARVMVEVDLSGSMMEMESKIQESLNIAGNRLTKEALEQFDTNGQPLQFGDIKFTARQKTAKEYETPYGCVRVERYIYQTSKGGKTYCPLDAGARIIKNSTPRFANIVSAKYVNQSAAGAKADLELSNGRDVSRCYIQDLAETVGAMASAVEDTMDYKIPKLKEPVATIAFSLDGTTILMQKDGYRETMAGTIALYDREGERLHTIYLGAAPEYGKEAFLTKMDLEIKKIKDKFPDAIYVGIADGAKSNWIFLDQHATVRILDFYHATEYLAGASIAFGKSPGEQKSWLDSVCHNLKHDANGAKTLLKEMKKMREIMPYHEKNTPLILEKLDKAITYFTNQMGRMNYAEYRDKNLPIGSGVTEAACKTLIKQRLCNSGMKWKHTGAQIVISLRAMARTDGRWPQFWDRINSQGLAGILVS
jgi:hypothetical protein